MKKTTFLLETLRRGENEGGFPDKSPQGLEEQNMAVKDTKEILCFEGRG